MLHFPGLIHICNFAIYLPDLLIFHSFVCFLHVFKRSFFAMHFELWLIMIDNARDQTSVPEEGKEAGFDLRYCAHLTGFIAFHWHMIPQVDEGAVDGEVSHTFHHLAMVRHFQKPLVTQLVHLSGGEQAAKPGLVKGSAMLTQWNHHATTFLLQLPCAFLTRQKWQKWQKHCKEGDEDGLPGLPFLYCLLHESVSKSYRYNWHGFWGRRLIG